MKEFNKKLFCDDLVLLRNDKTQSTVAMQLGVNRSTLSLLENGKQLPNIEVLSKVCSMNGKSVDSYFEDKTSDALVYFMGELDKIDSDKIVELINKIAIVEKYENIVSRI